MSRPAARVAALCLVVGIALAGCAAQDGSSRRDKPVEQRPKDALIKPSPKGPDAVDQTPRIIDLLEHGDITLVRTTHAQGILIVLRSGERFEGAYRQPRTGKYAVDRRLSDILNLARHILGQRRDLGEIAFICE